MDYRTQLYAMLTSTVELKMGEKLYEAILQLNSDALEFERKLHRASSVTPSPISTLNELEMEIGPC